MPEKGTQKESKGWRKTGSRVQSEVQPKGGSPGPTKADTGTVVAAADRATRERLASSPRGRTQGGDGHPMDEAGLTGTVQKVAGEPKGRSKRRR